MYILIHNVVVPNESAQYITIHYVGVRVCVCVCVCRFKPLKEKRRLQTTQVASLLSQIAAHGQSKTTHSYHMKARLRLPWVYFVLHLPYDFVVVYINMHAIKTMIEVVIYMSQQLGNEVERQGRQTSQLHPGQLFLFKEKKKSCPCACKKDISYL